MENVTVRSRPPYFFNVSPINVVINGYACPLLAIPTILSSIMVVYVFARRKMRSPTSVLLISLAVFDSIVCLSLLPESIYFYIMEHYKHYAYFNWCKTSYYLSFIHRVFRTSSNWITVLLGIERLIAVCFPFKARILCTVKMAVSTSFGVVIFSLVIHFWQIATTEVIALPSHDGRVLEPSGCYRIFASWFIQTNPDLKLSVMMHYLLSGCFSRLFPCLILIFTTIPVVYKLRTRDKPLRRHVSSSEQTNRITALVLVIVFVFLTVEIQDVIAFGIYIYEIASGNHGSVLPREVDVSWEAIGFLLTLVGYFCNFWIYILMSKQFRQVIVNVCTGCCH